MQCHPHQKRSQNEPPMQCHPHQKRSQNEPQSWTTHISVYYCLRQLSTDVFRTHTLYSQVVEGIEMEYIINLLIMQAKGKNKIQLLHIFVYLDWAVTFCLLFVCSSGRVPTDSVTKFQDFSRTTYVFSRTLMCYKLKHFCSQVTKNWKQRWLLAFKQKTCTVRPHFSEC